MLHTFVGRTLDEVHAKVRAPYTQYLKDNIHLLSGLAANRSSVADLTKLKGADLDAFEGVLKTARDFRDGPVFVHVHTQKGHGYGPAEEDNQKWHGVSATGAAPAAAPQYTKVFADAVAETMRREPATVAITAAMPAGTGLAPLSQWIVVPTRAWRLANQPLSHRR